MHVNGRAALLHRLAERVTAESETLAVLESLDVGKPIGAARGDVAFGADGLRYLRICRHARYTMFLWQ
jgi:acyl-CoA reductase-like NAD-dependent aldehyde dehydrogenase